MSLQLRTFPQSSAAMGDLVREPFSLICTRFLTSFTLEAKVGFTPSAIATAARLPEE